jgi:hypothetical protein
MKSTCFFKMAMILAFISGLTGCDGDGMRDVVSAAPRTLVEFEDALREAEGGARPDDPVNIAFAGRETAWNIYFILAKVGKYVNLDLSESSVTGFDNAVYPAGSGMIITITMPDNLSGIGNAAFKDWVRLAGVTIPPAVSRIGEYAFHGCSALVSVTIPSGVTSIGVNAFSSCAGLTGVTFQGSSTSIADDTVFPSGAALRTAAGGSGTGSYMPKDGTYKRQNEVWWRT